MVEPSPTCFICTEPITYFAIPETCNHNMFCWNCILRQRLKLEDMKCPLCKEASARVLITDNQNENLQGNWGTKIEDQSNHLVFARQEIWTEVRRKIGFYCTLCVDAQRNPTKQFTQSQQLREHYVHAHKVDFCKLCIENKPVLLFQQTLYKYTPLQTHISEQHPSCWFCSHEFFYDVEQLNVHYRKNHYFCDVCRKQNRRMRQVSRKSNNLPEFEVFKGAEELRQHYKKNHHVCDKTECMMQVFEDGVQLSEHYMTVHRITREAKLEFGFRDDSDSEQRKQQKLEKREQARKYDRDDFNEEIKEIVQEGPKKQIFKKQDFPSMTQAIQKPKEKQRQWQLDFPGFVQPTPEQIKLKQDEEMARDLHRKEVTKQMRETPGQHMLVEAAKPRDSQIVLGGGKKKKITVESNPLLNKGGNTAIDREEARQIAMTLSVDQPRVQTANVQSGIRREDFQARLDGSDFVEVKSKKQFKQEPIPVAVSNKKGKKGRVVVEADPDILDEELASQQVTKEEVKAQVKQPPKALKMDEFPAFGGQRVELKEEDFPVMEQAKKGKKQKGGKQISLAEYHREEFGKLKVESSKFDLIFK